VGFSIRLLQGLGVRIPPEQNLQPPALVILGGFSHDPRSGWTDVLRLARVPVELVFYSRLSFCHLTIGVYRELCITVFADSQYREICEPLYDSKVAPWHEPEIPTGRRPIARPVDFKLHEYLDWGATFRNSSRDRLSTCSSFICSKCLFAHRCFLHRGFGIAARKLVVENDVQEGTMNLHPVPAILNEA
jgi:hypothetical protein